MNTHHHLTVGDQPWCDWTGCKAGQDIDAKAGGHTCGHATGASAQRAAKALRPYFKRGAVRVASGPCPQAPVAD